MNRADSFSLRELTLQGGASKPVFLIQKSTTGEDTSRGIRGSSVIQETELSPRPLLTSVKGGFVTKNGKILKNGDVSITLSGAMITESVLSSKDTQIRFGNPPNGAILNIVDYERQDYAGAVLRFIVFARGITNV